MFSFAVVFLHSTRRDAGRRGRGRRPRGAAALAARGLPAGGPTLSRRARLPPQCLDALDDAAVVMRAGLRHGRTRAGTLPLQGRSQLLRYGMRRYRCESGRGRRPHRAAREDPLTVPEKTAVRRRANCGRQNKATLQEGHRPRSGSRSAPWRSLSWQELGAGSASLPVRRRARCQCRQRCSLWGCRNQKLAQLSLGLRVEGQRGCCIGVEGWGTPPFGTVAGAAARRSATKQLAEILGSCPARVAGRASC